MKRMQRMTAFILTLALAWSVAAQAAVGRMKVFEREERFVFSTEEYDLWYDVWFADEAGLWRSQKSTAPTLVLEMEGITAVEGANYGAYAAVTGDDGAQLLYVGENGSIYRWVLNEKDKPIQAIAQLDNHMALLVGEFWDSDLLIIEKMSGSMRMVEGLDGLATICPGKDGQSVLVSETLTGKIWRVNAQTMDMEEITPKNAFPSAMIEMEDGTIRLLHNMVADYIKIFEVQPDGETIEKGEIPVNGTLYGMDMTEKYVFLHIDGALYRYDMKNFEQKAREKTLTIALDVATGSDMRMQEAVRMFKAQHEDVDVKQVTVDLDQLTIELMAGQSGYDIFFLDPQSTDAMLKAGIFADLSAYPQIVEELENWVDMPGILYDKQGRLIRIPDRIMWEYYDTPRLLNYELLMETGLEIPERGMTYDEFRDLAVQAREKGVYLFASSSRMNNVMSLYDALYTDPLSGVLDYDTPEFRQMLSFWKEMHEQDLVFIAMTDEELNEERDDVLFVENRYFFGRRRTWHADPAVREWMYWPTADGRSALAQRVSGFYLYEYGAQKELAADFLACYASVQAQSREYEGDDLYLKDLTQYVNYENWTTPGMVNIVRYGITVEAQDVYPEKQEDLNELYANSVVYPWLGEIRMVSTRLLPEYFAGNVTLDEVVAQLNEKADILINE